MDFSALIAKMQQFITEQPLIFWSAVAVAAGIIIFFIIYGIVRHNKKKNNAAAAAVAERDSVKFVPVEEPDKAITAEFQTMQDKLISSSDKLDRKLLEQLRNKGPQALAEITSAYDKAQPDIQQQLKEFVREERLMERYSRRLTRPEYSQGVLLDAWSRFANTDTLKDFMEMLASPDEATQMAGVSLLSAMKDPQSLPLLAAALMWPEHFIPARVAEVFQSLGAPGVRLLVYLLPKVSDKHKARVLDTIASVEESFPPENVIACLSHEDPGIRCSAALALGSGRMSQSVAPLMIAASDSDWQVRAAVAKALGMIGDQRSVSVLDVLAQDKEGWVAESAKASLELFASA